MSVVAYDARFCQGLFWFDGFCQFVLDCVRLCQVVLSCAGLCWVVSCFVGLCQIVAGCAKLSRGVRYAKLATRRLNCTDLGINLTGLKTAMETRMRKRQSKLLS